MTDPATPTPPIARKKHTETRKHGVLLTDDYAWLRDKENPDVTAYLEAENAYADAVMAPLAGLREELYQEMLSHIKQTDISVSYRDGDWWYYSRTEEGKDYGILCRRPARGLIGDEIRSSTFAVSETINQVANVAGGLAGVLVSMLNNGQAGLSIAAGGLAVAAVLLVVRRRQRVRAA